MTPIIEQYIGKEHFEKVMVTFKDNQEAADEMLSFLTDFLTALECDDAIDEDYTPASLLQVPLNYIGFYAKSREQGFSIMWSKRYADYQISDDTRDLICRLYRAVAESSQEEADKDLTVFCRINDGDKLYEAYLKEGMADCDGCIGKTVEERAADYSRIFKEQVAKGKSELYAYHYARLMAGDFYDPIYCEDYAIAFERSILNHKSEEYANVYADKYASELIDVKARAGISENQDALSFAESKVEAYINGWEYATENNLDRKKEFIEYYEVAYLNTFYSDNPNEWNSMAECKEIALKKALERYGK